MTPNPYIENHNPYSNRVEVVYNSLFCKFMLYANQHLFWVSQQTEVATIIGVMRPHVDNINNVIQVVNFHPFI